ncbi:hypothetical protein [Nocardia sp. NPDC127526]|uniref:hypothetical protein n=1 Tax=Nocardia sp. NPDC127526 TaxID=3345393 RepID=UPI003633DED2
MSATRRRRKQLLDFVLLHGHDLETALTRLADYYDEEAHDPEDDCDDSCCFCDDRQEANSLRETRDELKQLLSRV